MGEQDGGLKIVKVGQTAPLLKRVRERLAPSPSVVKHTSKHRTSQPKHGILKHGKTARAKPRFEAVKDPAKAPPLKKSSRIQILTEKGMATRRAAIADDAKKRPISYIRKTLRDHKLNVTDHTPEELAREIYKDARGAGMIS